MINLVFVLFKYKSLYTKSEDLFKRKIINQMKKSCLMKLFDDKWTLIESPVHYVVYLIDLRFRGRSLKYTQVKAGEKQLQRQAGDEWSEYGKYYKEYHAKKEPFDDDWKLTLENDPTEPYDQLT